MITLDETFSAVSNPTRRAILARLTEGKATVTELAAPFDMTQPAISRHLKVLEEAGLIGRSVDGTKRPCHLNPEGFDAIDQWLATIGRSLAANYDRLDNVLAAPQLPTEPRKAK